ncbi:cytochrome P450 [Streptomyces sp. LBL]|uniref:hypothetical protein n=1 Tax=Streptomyces sp. LBL TaxID=2940562 RepID=UPI002476BD2C|nr:hypothetical protein [Streptomyces sp. LBL]MDH6629568.1 cytochrome P450 [Streptomyces sp. LBL]
MPVQPASRAVARASLTFLSVRQFPPEEIRAAMAEMNRYIAAHISHRRAHPGDDLVSARPGCARGCARAGPG